MLTLGQWLKTAKAAQGVDDLELFEEDLHDIQGEIVDGNIIIDQEVLRFVRDLSLALSEGTSAIITRGIQ
jgi:hypothetical protein